MKTRIFLPIIAVLVAAFALPTPALAQTLLKNTNQSRKTRSVLSGGSGNLIGSNSTTSFIGGGEQNTIVSGASYAFVGGGYKNTNSGDHATVAGGKENEAKGTRSAIGGGWKNEATGNLATIPGGYENKATNYSFAAGRYAFATNESSFVWSATTNDFYVPTASIARGSFTVRAPGGVRFITTTNTNNLAIDGPGNNGVALATNGTAWVSLSDSNAKTSVRAVDPRAVLEKLGRLPVTEWEYKHDPHRRYFGPMAQDFHASFGLGNDDKTINTLDADGVLFLSVKGLVEEIKLRDEKIAKLEAKNNELSRNIEAIKERLDSLPPTP